MTQETWRQEEPVASGSVGQVHRARLRAEHALDGPGAALHMDDGWNIVETSWDFMGFS